MERAYHIQGPIARLAVSMGGDLCKNRRPSVTIAPQRDAMATDGRRYGNMPGYFAHAAPHPGGGRDYLVPRFALSPFSCL